MEDGADHLVRNVLPPVPVRQWVLSLPRRVRFLAARRPALASRLLAVFTRAVFAWQRRSARRLGAVDPQTGGMTAIQRFGGALINVHFHTVIPDGVFAAASSPVLPRIQLHRSAPKRPTAGCGTRAAGGHTPRASSGRRRQRPTFPADLPRPLGGPAQESVRRRRARLPRVRRHGAYCRAGMRGCIVFGKVVFQDGQAPYPVWPPGADPRERAQAEAQLRTGDGPDGSRR